jgi:CHAD domain-containing protein
VRRLDQAISRNLAILFSTVSGIRDGQSEAIHDARVATRRLRAALPLAWAESPNNAWVSSFETIRQIGKQLGRVREVDVALEALPSLEARVPLAAPAIAELRRELAQRQARKRRRLIKNVERLSLDRVSAASLVPGRKSSLGSDRRWRAVARAIVDHSESLRQAVIDASGVYFPNRVHRVRVETKKLRYVLELVERAESSALVKRLRRTQEILGELHDHQLLALAVAAAKDLNGADRRLLQASAEARCDELFQLYLPRRSQLLEVCEQASSAAMQAAIRPQSVGGVFLTASAVAVPSALLWIARRTARRVESRSAAAHVDKIRPALQAANIDDRAGEKIEQVSGRVLSR